VSAVALLVVSAAVSNSVGGVRASIATAAVLTTAAVLSELRDVASIPVVAVSFAWLLGCAALAITTGARLPLRVLLDSSLPVVAFERCDRCSMTVTQGQGGYHLFVDGELRFSSIDERRWAEALTRSALARLKQPKRALVLSTGEGLIERELLADSGIESITSVVRCRLAADAARSSAWLRALTRDSMRSERVLLLEHDPAAFIAIQDGRTYDLVVVDLPDPANPILSKYYSRYFYRRLADRLNPGGVLVVQATSARRSPRTFATIGATLQAAGFSVLPQFVPLISRGEWGLYLASKSTIPSVLRPRWIETSLAGTISAQFDNAWPDTLPPQDFHAEPSTLDDAKVLDWFELESAGHRE
jgi:predicted membrane-bound spermidine synthase